MNALVTASTYSAMTSSNDEKAEPDSAHHHLVTHDHEARHILKVFEVLARNLFRAALGRKILEIVARAEGAACASQHNCAAVVIGQGIREREAKGLDQGIVDGVQPLRT